MSFGAGHMQDMNNRLKQNRDAKTSNKTKFKESNWDTRYTKELQKRTSLNFVELSEEELHYLKIEIQKQALKKMRLQNYLLIIIGLVLVTCVSLLLYTIN